MKTKHILVWTFFALSVVLAICGLIVFFIMDSIVENEIALMIPLKEGSTSYKNWLDPPVPVYMQFWLFDVKNGDLVQKKGVKPVLEQKGPYTYQEHRIKKDIKFHPNGTISYRQEKSYTFIEEMSNGSENDTVTNINLLLIGLAEKLKYQNKIINMIANAGIETFDGDNVFVEHTVHDWLWGYEDPAVHEITNIVKKIKKLLNITIHLPIPDRVGLYYGKNGTDDGLYTIYSGSTDVSNFSVVDVWNGSPKLNYWESDIANDINGTDGTMFPPFITKDDKLYIFSTDLCRSIDLVYEKQVNIRGINLMRFIPPEILFGNHTVNPDNTGFCTPTVENCLGSGVLNLSVCQGGLPAIMSQPHFFQADQKYRDAVIGLNPSAELSQTLVDVDPNTGVVLNAAKKIQVNLAIEPISGFDSLSKINLFMPLVWVNESATVDEKTANTFKSDVLSLINLAFTLKIVFLVISLLFMFGMLAAVIVMVHNNKDSSEGDQARLINESVEDNEPEHGE